MKGIGHRSERYNSLFKHVGKLPRRNDGYPWWPQNEKSVFAELDLELYCDATGKVHVNIKQSAP